MPLYAPPTQDFLQKTLDAQLLTGVTASATLNNTTGLANLPGVMIVDRINTNNVETPSAREVIAYTGTSGATVTTLSRGLAGTTDQDHAVGAIVEFTPDIIWADSIYDALANLVDTTTLAVDTTKVVTPSGTQTLTNKTLTSPTFTGTVILPKTLEIQDTSGDHQYVLAVSELAADRTITLPLLASSDTFVFAAFTQTLTNKRVTKRTGTTTSSATPTINTDNVDFYSITAQTEAITSFTTNLSGTPTEGQTLWIAITGTASRAITWGASFEASGNVALPTTTSSTTRLDVGFVWNTVSSKWRCIAVA